MSDPLQEDDITSRKIKTPHTPNTTSSSDGGTPTPYTSQSPDVAMLPPARKEDGIMATRKVVWDDGTTTTSSRSSLSTNTRNTTAVDDSSVVVVVVQKKCNSPSKNSSNNNKNNTNDNNGNPTTTKASPSVPPFAQRRGKGDAISTTTTSSSSTTRTQQRLCQRHTATKTAAVASTVLSSCTLLSPSSLPSSSSAISSLWKTSGQQQQQSSSSLLNPWMNNTTTNSTKDPISPTIATITTTTATHTTTSPTKKNENGGTIQTMTTRPASTTTNTTYNKDNEMNNKDKKERKQSKKRQWMDSTNLTMMTTQNHNTCTSTTSTTRNTSAARTSTTTSTTTSTPIIWKNPLSLVEIRQRRCQQCTMCNSKWNNDTDIDDTNIDGSNCCCHTCSSCMYNQCSSGIPLEICYYQMCIHIPEYEKAQYIPNLSHEIRFYWTSSIEAKRLLLLNGNGGSSSSSSINRTNHVKSSLTSSSLLSREKIEFIHPLLDGLIILYTNTMQRYPTLEMALSNIPNVQSLFTDTNKSIQEILSEFYNDHLGLDLYMDYNHHPLVGKPFYQYYQQGIGYTTNHLSCCEIYGSMEQCQQDFITDTLYFTIAVTIQLGDNDCIVQHNKQQAHDQQQQQQSSTSTLSRWTLPPALGCTSSQHDSVSFLIGNNRGKKKNNKRRRNRREFQVTEDQAWGGYIAFCKKRQLPLPKDNIPFYWTIRVPTSQWLEPHGSGTNTNTRTLPRIGMIVDDIKLVFMAKTSSILGAGLGLWLECTRLGVANDDRAIDGSVFRLPCGTMIDLGIYAPLLESDIKTTNVCFLKNLLFNWKCEAWSFSLVDGSQDYLFDITDDRTGDIHETAQSNIIVYTNETDGKNEIPSIHPWHDAEGRVHYLLGHGKKEHGPLEIRLDQPVELKVDYGELYERVRVRKGYPRVRGMKLSSLKNEIENDDRDVLMQEWPIASANCIEELTVFMEKFSLGYWVENNSESASPDRVFMVLLALYQRCRQIVMAKDSITVDDDRVSLSDNGLSQIYHKRIENRLHYLLRSFCRKLQYQHQDDEHNNNASGSSEEMEELFYRSLLSSDLYVDILVSVLGWDKINSLSQLRNSGNMIRDAIFSLLGVI